MTLKDTNAATHLDVGEFPRDLLVTDDFARTVKLNYKKNDLSDLFQRPVQWILTSASTSRAVNRMVIISPYEAHELLRVIRASEHVTLHLYSPRMNIGYPPLDHLALYTIPERTVKRDVPISLLLQLNIFAGQLYMKSFSEYIITPNRFGTVLAIYLSPRRAVYIRAGR